ncbi:helix-turn-helix transcriptional regulator [Rhodopirellula bahusiensis]|uniref:helix-turn-helix transcriptional regulator n=1 Tax=Rhodopirellula bahusiensis TaxID=2014065 RepID=UPI003D646FB8
MESILSNDTLFTKQELSSFLKVSTRTVERYCSSGKFPRGFKISGARRWKKSDVLDAIENRESVA